MYVVRGKSQELVCVIIMAKIKDKRESRLRKMS